MNNWRRFRERVDVWVIRFSTEAKLRYWGITNLSPSDAVRVLGIMKVLPALSTFASPSLLAAAPLGTSVIGEPAASACTCVCGRTIIPDFCHRHQVHAAPA